MYSNWTAFSSWSKLHSDERRGSLRVMSQYSRSPIFGYEAHEADGASHLMKNQTTVPKPVLWDTTIAAFVKAVTETSNTRFYYLSEPLRNLGAAMLADVAGYEELAVHELTTSPGQQLVSLWGGSRNATTALHYDLDHNVVIQVQGRKRFVLWDPQSMTYLCTFGFLHTRHRTSQVPLPPASDEPFPRDGRWPPRLDPGAVARCPSAPEALMRAQVVDLAEGDALYVPPLWGHHVTSLGGGGAAILDESSPPGDRQDRVPGLSLSVNVFSGSSEWEMLSELDRIPVPFEAEWVQPPGNSGQVLGARGAPHRRPELRAAACEWASLIIAAFGAHPAAFCAEMLATRFDPATATAAAAASRAAPDADAKSLGRDKPFLEGANVSERVQAVVRIARRLAELAGEGAAKLAVQRYVEMVAYNFVGTESAAVFLHGIASDRCVGDEAHHLSAQPWPFVTASGDGGAEAVVIKRRPQLFSSSPVFSSWKAASTWTPDWLSARGRSVWLRDVWHATQPTLVYASQGGDRGGPSRMLPHGDSSQGTEAGGRPAAHRLELSLADFFAKGRELVAAGQGEILYWQDGVSALGPDLAADVGPLEPFDLKEAKSQREALVWLGTANATTHCHYDLEHNFYAQLSGTKTFDLWPPDALSRLAIHPTLHSKSRQSSLLDPTHAVPPPLRAELHPGDMLYVPPLWSHQVQALTPTSISVSVFTQSREREAVRSQLPGLALPWEAEWPARDRLVAAGEFVAQVLIAIYGNETSAAAARRAHLRARFEPLQQLSDAAQEGLLDEGRAGGGHDADAWKACADDPTGNFRVTLRQQELQRHVARAVPSVVHALEDASTNVAVREVLLFNYLEMVAAFVTGTPIAAFAFLRSCVPLLAVP